MTDEQAARDGRNAEQAMAVIDPALAKVREALIAALIATGPENTERVLTLHRTAQNLDALRKVIADVIANGKLSAAILDGLS